MCGRTSFVLVCSVCAAWASLPFADGPIDTVVMGDSVSEREHSVSRGRNHVERGALGVPCRRLAPGDRLSFVLKCDPSRPVYLTVKLWGGDTGAGQLYVYTGGDRIGRYLDEWPELDLLSSEPAFPGRFYYSTYLLPEYLTRGRRYIRLGLGGAGRPTPYSTTRKEADQRALSRGIYRAYTHLDPFFVPSREEKQGAAPAAVRGETKTSSPPIEHLHRQLDLAITRLLTWQYYGSEWEALVAAHEAPRILTGEINTHGIKNPHWTLEQWKDTAAQRMGGNRVNLLVVEVFARAYQAKWSKYHHDPELLDRVIEALDYFRLAQGSNGGFDDIWTHKWVGGPRRRRAGNCLEGFGQQGLGAAFLTVEHQLASTPYLNQLVDEDANPDTPAIPRRQAWANLFAASRDYLTSSVGRGHAPNQDMADQLAAYLSNRALRVLAPERAWSKARMRDYLDSAAGFKPDIYGGRWLSRKGLSLEPNGSLNGGFCGNYGPAVIEPLFRLAERTGDPKLRTRALQAMHVLAHFQYPSLSRESHPCIRLEGVVTWRNNKNPGKVYYGGNPYAAVVLKDPLSLRQIQLAAAHGYYGTVRLTRYWAHFVWTTTYWLRNVDRLEQALALPPTAARLPFEAGRPDWAWADEEAGVVVMKRGNVRLAASLNWRHGFKQNAHHRRSLKNVRINNLARVHYTTPTIDRIANVRMKTIGGFRGMYVCRYGPVLVAMNRSTGKSIEVDVPADLRHRRTWELIQGRPAALGEKLRVPPSTTRVLWFKRK